MDKSKKKELVEKVAHGLDITPDMYNRSESVVRGITTYLKNIDPSIQVYKQGSFKLGTIVRPCKKDRKGDFDVDIVVQFSYDKNTINPSAIKDMLGGYLKRSNYRGYLDAEGRRCWTLNYPHREGESITSFHIDLLPCVHESASVKNTIKPDAYKNTAVAITHISDRRTNPYTYAWRQSNPQGFAKWFDDINYGRYTAIKASDRQRVFENYRSIFSSIEAVGNDYTRSPFQMVIQILKRHRDVMYANKERECFKPISIIITTLVGKIVEENHVTENNTYELLNIVLEGLAYYSSLQTEGITSDFAEEFKTKQLVQKHMVNGKSYWSIKNPANSGENLADKWCADSSYAVEFFRWVKQAQSDLVDILETGKPDDIIAKFKFCLGEEIGNLLGGFKFADCAPARPVVITPTTPKPYGER